MSNWEIAGAVIGAVCFVIWVPCMISWMRRGIAIPRYVHLVAGALTCVGLGCLIGLIAGGMVTLNLLLALVLVPPALTYFGWFWMFGPDNSAVLNERSES